MKNIIVGALCALTVASSALAMEMGNDKGNGGDAILINNEMVMRDFVARTNVTEVENNIEFLNSIPGFRELLNDIAKGNGSLAYQIMIDLFSDKFYLADSDLEILPSGQTAVGGIKAQVQLAIRWNNEIVISPKFFTPEFKEQRKYLILHEALHGILMNADGALHHQRVRAIVNYLKTQRGQYNPEELKAVLTKNYFGRQTDVIPEVLFDASIAMPVRCYVLDQNYEHEAVESMTRSYLQLNCLERYSNGLEAYTKSRLKITYIGSERIMDILTLALREEPARFYVLDWKEIGDMSKRYQQSVCWDSRDEGQKGEEQFTKNALAMRILNDATAFMGRTDVRDEEKKAIRHFVESDFVSSRTLAEKTQILSEKNDKLIKLRQEVKINEKKCVAKLGRSLGVRKSFKF